jgi:adenylate cyclase
LVTEAETLNMSVNWGEAAAKQYRRIVALAIATAILLLVGLPLALWLNLRSLSAQALLAQARDLGHALDAVQDFYANDVIARIQAANGGPITVTDHYRFVNGGVPIPATFSIELGRLVGSGDASMQYRFVSDFPFPQRPPHDLDAFERQALSSFRAGSSTSMSEVTGSVFNRTVRMATPLIMTQACVECHNSLADSPKRDWKLGDVGGIQAVTLREPINANLLAFKYLLVYVAAALALGVFFVWMQRRQRSLIEGLNRELEGTNEFLAGISHKISKYLSPQIYKSIFSGQKDTAIATERKKLTIFFSDIKDFTATTESMQPEELTLLLNEYLTEMSQIALAHGGTLDKFIGDAILVFFGDPETKGVEEDARACLRMAAEMQRRLVQLDERWSSRGIAAPFRARMGINTGFCNVGNFGSSERMEYTIIGSEANLAARLQSIGEPGKIVLSYETYALVSDMVCARPLDPIAMKGISRKIVPYLVDEVVGEHTRRPKLISERAKGLNLFLDLEVLDRNAVQDTRKALQEALSALDDVAAGQEPAAGAS